MGIRTVGWAALFGLVAGVAAAQPAGTGLGELQRVGPPGRQLLTVGVDVPGFEELEPAERVLMYMLSRAAIAGDGIFTRQVHRHAPDVVALLDALDRHNGRMPPALAQAVRQELVRALIHHGPYDQREHLKHERWTLNHTMLADAVDLAQADGARLPRGPNESAADMLKRLAPVLLDLDVDGVHVEQRKDLDIIAGSASNIYAPGVTHAMMGGLLGYWQEKINVRFDLRDGRLFMQPYRVGALYGKELGNVIYWLRKALPLAEPGAQRNSIHALIDFYLTGDEALFREHSVYWLNSRSRVDYLNGFVESYMDPRGVVGSFEANAVFRADSALLEKLAQAAPYFEARMPWEKKWQRAKVAVPVATVVNAVIETGDAGPLSATAYNLPNYNDIRRDHGSKNVVLLNVELARSEEDRRTTIAEFYPAAERNNALTHGVDAMRWLTYMHEVIGHGSGQQDPSAKTGQRVLKGRTAAALEECRADLVALYQVLDPKMVEMGAFKDAAQQQAVARAMYAWYLASDLTAMRSDPGLVLREAHRRGNHLVVSFLLDGGGRKKDYGVQRQVADGKTFYALVDVRKARTGVADLLGTLQRHKSLVEDAAATDLFEKYGNHLDSQLKKEVMARAEPLNLPRLKALVFPRLVPVVQGGQVVDVRRVHDEDLVAQKRRFMALAEDRTLEQGNSPSGGPGTAAP